MGNIWIINGITQRLSSTWTNAFSVFVSGNDVFIMGREAGTPVFRRNGTVQRLSTPASANVFHFYVSPAGDVFMVGSETIYCW
ncbi:MAG: hypothetical protein FWC36_11085 [Spirochaetes bacterium]|nr:hypothetical protein [Spirochaetota bacterium]